MGIYDFAGHRQLHIAQLRVRPHPVHDGERGDAVTGVGVVCLGQELIAIARRRRHVARRLRRVVLNLLTILDGRAESSNIIFPRLNHAIALI